MTGLQFGGIRDFLRDGEKNGDNDWNLFRGLSGMPADVREIVKSAVLKGRIEKEHNVKKIKGDAFAVDRKKDRAEKEKRFKKESGIKEEPDVDNIISLDDSRAAPKEEPQPPHKPTRPPRKPKVLLGNAAQYRGLPVCYVCQTNEHAHKDCPRTKTNREIADREAFAPSLLPENAP